MASRKSGLDTRLIGQALAGPRPLDVAKPVGEAIARGEQAFERLRKERKEEEEKIAKEEKERQNLQARAIAGLEDFDKSKVPLQLREAITKEAFALKKGAMEIISNKNLDPITAQLEVQKYKQGINDLAIKANDFKEWYKQFADTTQDDLSKLNNSFIYRKVNDIAKGNFKYKDGMFVLEGEEPMTFDDMLNIRHINRRSDTYLTLLENTKKSALTAGSKNGSLDVFKTSLEDSIDATRMTDADIASVLVDELNYSDENDEIRKQIKRDFETDGSFDDKDENGNNIREKYLGLIKEKLMKAAEERFFEGTKAYNKKLAASGSKKAGTDYYTDAANMLQSVYNKLPGKLEGAEGKEQTTRAIIDIVKSEPIFGDSEIEDPAAAKDAIVKGLMEDKDLNYSKAEAESFYNKKYGNALIVLNGQPVNDINGLLAAYNRKLTSAKRLTNSQMKEIINSIGVGTGSIPTVIVNQEYAK